VLYSTAGLANGWRVSRSARAQPSAARACWAAITLAWNLESAGVDFVFDLLGLRVLARSLVVSALLGSVAAIIDITPAAAVVLAVIQE
jgi:uncharacterized membrane-anchored protein